MAQLEDVSTAALREALQDADDATTTKRIMVAIAYKQGVSQTELADWYGLSRKTVYNWLQRFEEEPIRSAASDKPRSGRPPKLGGEDRDELLRLLRDSPKAAGYDAEEWNIPLVQRLVAEQFDVAYSRTSAYRILSSVCN
ncbi:hypothetical protein A4G99_15250 [Haladaptatus sp. R4]|uniref:helix-turn-helix domain-containing protein n=1 Tax=Haladaptatus sp. R4 TaxID=1679489 RepID=UPI0007B4D8C1|nr:helix-turn-helix domain-containing protein [Haladaptatus sp. R4]KZN23368.1 hypothetical protein A4G99_15250 [Haladaptatus sp. R4]